MSRMSPAASASNNRIGSKFLHAGPGFGGSCFPKDTLALIKTAQDNDAPIRIVETVAAVNDTRKTRHGPQGRQGLRRRRPRQAYCHSRPDLQAQYRRHARFQPAIAIIRTLQDMGAR